MELTYYLSVELFTQGRREDWNDSLSSGITDMSVTEEPRSPLVGVPFIPQEKLSCLTLFSALSLKNRGVFGMSYFVNRCFFYFLL